jgi:hypothetical protein
MEIAAYWFFGEDRIVDLEEAERDFISEEKKALLKPMYKVDDSKLPVGLVAV